MLFPHLHHMNCPFLKSTLLLFVFLTSLNHVSAQTKIKEYLSLTGTVNMLCVFVDTDEGEWEEDEKEAYYKEFLVAQDWIIEEAQFYDKVLQFDNDRFFIDNLKQIYIDRIDMRSGSRFVSRKMLAELGYDSMNDLLSSNRFDLKKDKFKIVLLVKQSSRSHAYNFWSVESVDLAIVYCRHTMGLSTDKYVMAHEMLHQFGAWDLYAGESQTTESAAKARELFPNSVMANTFSNKELLEVDALTAWRIGWNEFDESFAEFNPKHNRAAAREEMEAKQKARSGKKSNEIRFDLGKKKN